MPTATFYVGCGSGSLAKSAAIVTPLFRLAVARGMFAFLGFCHETVPPTGGPELVAEHLLAKQTATPASVAAEKPEEIGFCSIWRRDVNDEQEPPNVACAG